MISSYEINKKLKTSSRVKCIDPHPMEPWILCALYNGEITIWNYETLNCKVIKVTIKPLRIAKFIPRKNWIVTGSDDM